MDGFVDVLILPRNAGAWPEPGQVLRFEVLQHRPGQVRLWPLDPTFRHDEATTETESGWQQAKLRCPVGSAVLARVAEVFPSIHEYVIAFTGDDDERWSRAVLPWAGEPPVVGSVGPYRIAAHRDATRRIMVTPAPVPPT